MSGAVIDAKIPEKALSRHRQERELIKESFRASGPSKFSGDLMRAKLREHKSTTP